MQAAGFVLVGGQSSRMGRDKARLRIGSGLLVEDVAGKLASCTASVTLVGPPERYADLPFECLPDLRPGLGPLAGIEAALVQLRRTQSDYRLRYAGPGDRVARETCRHGSPDTRHAPASAPVALSPRRWACRAYR